MTKLSYIALLGLILLFGCSRPAEITVVSDTVADPESKTLGKSIGIETLGGVFTPLLPSGCTLPCEVTQVFSTADDNQDQISITLLAGDVRLASEAQKLGKYQISGIAPAPRGAPQIAVTLRVSHQGLRLLATDKNGGSQLAWQKLK